MPYRKRYYKRRYARRRSTLSTRNIYAKRSSISQAGQIAALRNKVNKVYKVCKPEMKRYYGLVGQFNFNNTISGAVDHAIGDIPVAEGTGLDDRVGDKIYCKTKYLLTFEYFNNSSTGYHNSESAGCQLRIIVGRYKTPMGSGDAPLATDIIESYASSGGNYTISSVAPLKANVTENHFIDYDKTFYLTTTTNQKIVKASTRRYLRRFGDNKSNHAWILIICAGLHADANFTEEVNYAVARKITFTDA